MLAISSIIAEASAGERICYKSFGEGLRPDPVLSVSEWADTYRKLSTKASAEPGQWRTDRTPYLREIMDVLSPSSPYERAVFMKGGQIGATECGNNWIGYVIHQAPGPMMAVQPTVEMAKRNSKQRIDTLIEESEILSGLVRSPRARDSGNTVLSKEFPGGVLVMTGANSAVGLRSMAARYLFLDEVDGYLGDVDGEGDPVQLAMTRTRTFARRKVFMASTPKTKGSSRIESAFEESDKRFYWVPCPFCKEFQTLKFSQLRWPKDAPRDAVYLCEHCGQTDADGKIIIAGAIRNHHKQGMLSRGEWRASAPGNGKTAGFHLSSLYSPVGWFSWEDAAEMFDNAQKNPSKLQVFVNTVLGETWADATAPPDWHRLYERREQYKLGTVPARGLFLTAGVDVQADRIEIQVVAWGRRMESWLVDYVVIDGRPPLPQLGPRLADLLNTTYPHQYGHDMRIMRLAIDAGAETTAVYEWAKVQGPGRVIAVHGRANGTSPIWCASAVDTRVDGKKLRRGLRPWMVATGMLKSELYGWLNLDAPADGEQFRPGYCHFPEGVAESFFEQLTAEEFVTEVRNGVRVSVWKNLPGRRNEALDTRVYARAAASHVGVDRFNDRHWRRLEAQFPAPLNEHQPTPFEQHQVAIIEPVPAQHDQPVANKPKPTARRVFRSGWMSR